MKNDIFRSDIGLGFGERGGTHPLRIPRVPPGGECFKRFVLRILLCNAPFLVPGFAGRKNNFVPVSFGKREDTGDEGGQKKWDELICLV